MRAFVVSCALCILTVVSTGCVTRTDTTKETATETTKKVTKTEEKYVIDNVANVPDLGAVTIKGTISKTTYSEELTELEAAKDKKLTQEYPLVNSVTISAIKAGSKLLSGDIVGGLQELYIAITGSLAIAGIGYGAKKHGEIKAANNRIERAEANEDELYNDLKATKTNPDKT